MPASAHLLPLFLFLLSLHGRQWTVSGFTARSFSVRRLAPQRLAGRLAAPWKPLHASPQAQETVDRLVELVDGDSTEDDDEIRTLVMSLNDDSQGDDEPSFSSLLGNYNVSHVIPNKPNEKPVGGKWSRGLTQAMLSTKRTLQNLLKPNKKDSVAEAVNVISLSALGDAFRINVILRGDAYALSERERVDIAQERQTPGGLSPKTARVQFDAPRIVVGRKSPLFSLSVGPTSSVVLDTPYCDDQIRIGKGSKGSLFVFKRCFDQQADEWKALLEKKPVSKSKALAVLAGCCSVGAVACARAKGLLRIGGAALSVLSLLSAILIGVSSGGIEDRGREESMAPTST